jgi:fimbrial isopeptide formation D2 family protein/LPXTG-motif cell wall-anchored protein
MKNIKKILLVIIMLFSLTVIVNAEDAITITTTDGVVTNKQNVSVSNVKSADDRFAAYQILEAHYNSTTNQVTYEFTNLFNSFLDSSEGTAYKDMTVKEYASLTGFNDGKVKQPDTNLLDPLASQFAIWLKKQNPVPAGTALTTTGTKASASVPAGAYLILPTATENIYAVMVGNVELVANGTNWTLPEVPIEAKASDPAVVEKTSSGTSVSIGEKYTYTITATIPTYPANAKNKTYKITDTMDEGITYHENSLKIKDAAGNELTVDSTGNIKSGENKVGTYNKTTDATNKTIFTIEFTDLDKIGNKTTITYDAELNNKALIGDKEEVNVNTVKIKYTKDPYSDDETPEEKEKEVPEYTYGLEVVKVDGSDNTKKLQGAVFELYKEDKTTLIDTLTTDGNGFTSYTGLAAGTYYLKETVAPNGYDIREEMIPVVVKNDGSVTGTQDGYYTITIDDPKSIALPFTGGIGTIIFTLIGVALIGGASFAYIKHSKKENEE